MKIAQKAERKHDKLSFNYFHGILYSFSLHLTGPSTTTEPVHIFMKQNFFTLVQKDISLRRCKIFASKFAPPPSPSQFSGLVWSCLALVCLRQIKGTKE